MGLKMLTLLFVIILLTFTDLSEFSEGQIVNDEASKLPWNNTPVFWRNGIESTTLILTKQYNYSQNSSLLITTAASNAIRPTDKPREMFDAYTSNAIRSTNEPREVFDANTSNVIRSTDENREVFDTYISNAIRSTDKPREVFDTYDYNAIRSTDEPREVFDTYTSNAIRSTGKPREVFNVYNSNAISQHVSLLRNFFKITTDAYKSRMTNTTVSGQLYLLSNQSNNSSMFYISQSQTTEYSLLKNSVSSKAVSDLNDLNDIYPLCNFETCGVGAHSSTRFCRCDENCTRYNDCCIDAGFKNNLNREDDLLFECSPVNNMRYNKTGIYIIKTCPADMLNSSIEVKCQNSDILAVGPWVVSDTNIVFQNRFCAECNGINAYTPFLYLWSNVPSDYIQDSINLTIAGKIQYKSTFFTRFIIKELVPPEGVIVRQCIVLSEPTLNYTRDCLENTINPVYIDKDHYYRNRFCISPSRWFLCLVNSQFIGTDNNLYGMFPLSIMFPFTKMTMRCPKMISGFCIGDEIYENLFVRKEFSLVSQSKIVKTLETKILIVMAWALSLDRKWTTALVSFPTDKSVLITKMRLDGHIKKKLNAYDMLEFEQKTLYCEWNIEIQSPEEQIHIANIQNRVYDNISYTSETIFVTDRSIETVMDDFNISIGQNLSKVICDKYIIRCEIKKEDSKLMVKEVRCADDVIQSQLTFYVGSKSVITYTGIGLSIIALIVSVVVHRRLGLYKTIPGSNIENMSFSLLIADILFIVGVGANDHQLICYSVGVALHYLWLLVFSFKTISLVYMCHNLRKMTVNRAHSAGKTVNTKACLTMFGLVLPLAFIIPAVALDRLTQFNLDYNGSICFPTAFPANLIFVSVPIGLAVFTNIACLIVIAVIITKQSLETRHIRKSSSFQHVFVFARISAVTGIFWICGILGSILQTELMEYIFITCCSLQGLTVAIANLTTRQVRRTSWKQSV